VTGSGSMRAVRLVRAGGSVTPRVVEVPMPAAPTGTQVLVQVAASSVNGSDLGLLRGGRLFRALSGGRVAPGFDVAGEVVACGPAVTGFSAGDRVMALIGHGGGGLAELVLLPQHRVARAPRTVDLQQAAGIPLAGLTALQALHGRAALHARTDARVLVVGAAGGIGAYAVQLARLAGASVTAVADPARADFVRDLGASVVVDRHRDDVLAGGRRWDVVLDAPGALRFAAVRPALTDGGVLVSTRPLSPDTVRGLRPGSGPRATAVATRRSPVDLAHLAHLVDTARLRVPLDRVVPLDDVASAFAHAGSGRLRGKVVVSLAAPA
jgi:NADPH:quinone reductase-like Zn-dependent oxidoreductase